MLKSLSDDTLRQFTYTLTRSLANKKFGSQQKGMASCGQQTAVKEDKRTPRALTSSSSSGTFFFLPMRSVERAFDSKKERRRMYNVADDIL